MGLRNARQTSDGSAADQGFGKELTVTNVMPTATITDVVLRDKSDGTLTLGLMNFTSTAMR